MVERGGLAYSSAQNSASFSYELSIVDTKIVMKIFKISNISGFCDILEDFRYFDLFSFIIKDFEK